MICNGISNNKQYCLTYTFKSIKADKSYSKFLDIDSSNKLLVITDTYYGLTYNLTDEERKCNPFLLFKKMKKMGKFIL